MLALHDHCRHLDQSIVTALIDARERDMEDAPFADLPALTAYARVTSAPLMKLAAQQLDAQVDDAVIDAAGTAYALAGILRAAPHLLARQRVLLPLDLLSAQGLSPEAVYQTETRATLRPIYARIASEAEALLQMARQQKVARAALPALLPATLGGLALKTLRRNGHDPAAAEIAITPLKKQMALLWASLRGRL